MHIYIYRERERERDRLQQLVYLKDVRDKGAHVWMQIHTLHICIHSVYICKPVPCVTGLC